MNTYCPKCGGMLEAKYFAEDQRTRQVCTKCGAILYKNAKPCVGVLVLRDNELLLIKRGIEPFKGYWDIPGGFLEVDEHPADGARREIKEETGLHIEPTEILDIFMDEYGSTEDYTLNVCYIAKVVAGEAVAGSDATAIQWFPMTALPENIAFAWAKEALDLLKNRLA
ncbi:MAG: NUDIX hydrolase [Chloroflexota bacterium]